MGGRLTRIGQGLEGVCTHVRSSIGRGRDLSLGICVRSAVKQDLLAVHSVVSDKRGARQGLRTLRGTVNVLTDGHIASIDAVSRMGEATQRLNITMGVSNCLPHSATTRRLAIITTGRYIAGYVGRTSKGRMCVHVTRHNRHCSIAVAGGNGVPARPVGRNDNLSALHHDVRDSNNRVCVSRGPHFTLLVAVPAGRVDL